MASEPDILLALRNRLVAFAQPRSLPIAFTNKNFSAPATGKYLRETFLPNGTLRPEVADDSTPVWQGLYQIDVFWPQNGGETEPLALAAAIADHFSPATRLQGTGVTVRIPSRPSTSPLMVTDTRAMIATTVQWRVE